METNITSPMKSNVNTYTERHIKVHPKNAYKSNFEINAKFVFPMELTQSF